MIPQSLARSVDPTMSIYCHAHKSAGCLGSDRSQMGSVGFASRLQIEPTASPYGSLRRVCLTVITRNPRRHVYFPPILTSIFQAFS